MPFAVAKRPPFVGGAPRIKVRAPVNPVFGGRLAVDSDASSTEGCVRSTLKVIARNSSLGVQVVVPVFETTNKVVRRSRGCQRTNLLTVYERFYAGCVTLGCHIKRSMKSFNDY